MILLLPVLFSLCCLLGQGPQFEVVIGSGEVSAQVEAETREQVRLGLAELVEVFPGLEPKRFFVFLHESGSTLPDSLAAVRHEGAPGFALLGRHQVHLVIGDMRRTGASLASVVRHELVHELLDQFVAPARGELPRWYHEGLAQHLARDTYLGAREEDLVWRVGVRRMLHFTDLRRRFPSEQGDLRAAYAQSYSYVSWLVQRFGLDEVIHVAADTGAERTFDEALVRRTQKGIVELQDAWLDYLVYGSGAWWRVLLGQCFNALLFLALPALAVAWWRRRRRARGIGARMERREAMFPHEFDLERIDRELRESARAEDEKPGRDRGGDG